MLGRSAILRAAAIIVLITCFIATLTLANRSPLAPVAADPRTTTTPPPDDLSAELHRCDALGPQDAENARCVVVWEENRRRFLGGPARPLPSRSLPGTAASVSSSPGDAR